MTKHNASLDFWARWAAKPQADETELYDGTMAIVHALHDAAFYDEWDRIRQYQELYRRGEAFCREEPFLTIYERGAMMSASVIADCQLTLGDYRGAYSQVEEIRSALQELRERNPFTQGRLNDLRIRLTILHVLAAAKWEGPYELRDTVLPPQEVLEEFEALAGEWDRYFANSRQSAKEQRPHRDAMGLAEIELCKMVLRFLPDQLAARVKEFNRRHGPHLAEAAGHYKTLPHWPDESSYYWDFELAKLQSAGILTAEDVTICSEHRAASARRTFGDWPLTGLYRKWRKQSLSLLHALLQSGTPK
jgi:hypothetical protein